MYSELECLIVKIDRWKNNPKNSSATKVIEHISKGFSMSIILAFLSTEKKHYVYRGKDFI